MSRCSTPLRFEPGEVETVEDAQGQEELEALAGRGRHMHQPVAIGGGERLAPLRGDPGEVGHGQRAALCRDMGRDRLAEWPVVEMARPLRGDVAQGRRQLGLAQDLAERDALAALAQVVARPVLVELRPLAQQRRLLVEFSHAEFGDREAVFGERDRRREDLLQGQAAIAPVELAPAGEIAGRGNRKRAALEIGALAEALMREALRHGRHEIENAHAPLGRDPHRGGPHAGEARHERLDHVERRRDRPDCVEDVAALGEDARAGLRRQRVRGGDHAVQGAHRRAAAIHRAYPVLVSFGSRVSAPSRPALEQAALCIVGPAPPRTHGGSGCRRRLRRGIERFLHFRAVIGDLVHRRPEPDHLQQLVRRRPQQRLHRRRLGRGIEPGIEPLGRHDDGER